MKQYTKRTHVNRTVGAGMECVSVDNTQTEVECLPKSRGPFTAILGGCILEHQFLNIISENNKLMTFTL